LFLLQILPDFLPQFLEKFGVGLTQGRGFLGGGLPSIPPSGQAIPVIFAKGLEGRILLKKLPNSCRGLRKLFQD
jgi:hypothetical protein